MDRESLMHKISSNPRPVILDLWAPWCGPCRMMEPSLNKVKSEFQSKVDVWKINVDDNPELARDLKVMGIPAFLVFQEGKELFRSTGAQSETNLRALFTAAIEGKKPAYSLNLADRILRLGLSAVLFFLGLSNPPGAILYAASAILFFSAIYDRCPIYKTIAPRLMKWINDKKSA